MAIPGEKEEMWTLRRGLATSSWFLLTESEGEGPDSVLITTCLVSTYCSVLDAGSAEGINPRPCPQPGWRLAGVVCPHTFSLSSAGLEGLHGGLCGGLESDSNPELQKGVLTPFRGVRAETGS